jgi:general secretion pathway protein G
MNRARAFTLIELLIAVAVIALLGVIAVPVYVEHVDEARINTAKTDIKLISLLIERHRTINNQRLPDKLEDLTDPVPLDPYGNGYQYLRIEGAGLKGKGKLRKDKNLNPLNTDYDLYSMGKDGDTKLPLTAKPSRDDIVRASNGAFVGLAIDY